jgi:hypothetical protein
MTAPHMYRTSARLEIIAHVSLSGPLTRAELAERFDADLYREKVVPLLPILLSEGDLLEHAGELFVVDYARTILLQLGRTPSDRDELCARAAPFLGMAIADVWVERLLAAEALIWDAKARIYTAPQVVVPALRPASPARLQRLHARVQQSSAPSASRQVLADAIPPGATMVLPATARLTILPVHEPRCNDCGRALGERRQCICGGVAATEASVRSEFAKLVRVYRARLGADTDLMSDRRAEDLHLSLNAEGHWTIGAPYTTTITPTHGDALSAVHAAIAKEVSLLREFADRIDKLRDGVRKAQCEIARILEGGA